MSPERTTAAPSKPGQALNLWICMTRARIIRICNRRGSGERGATDAIAEMAAESAVAVFFTGTRITWGSLTWVPGWRCRDNPDSAIFLRYGDVALRREAQARFACRRGAEGVTRELFRFGWVDLEFVCRGSGLEGRLRDEGGLRPGQVCGTPARGACCGPACLRAPGQARRRSARRVYAAPGVHNEHRLGVRDGGAIGTAFGDGLVDVGHGDNAGFQAELRGDQTLGIAGAIELLVVSAGDLRDFGEGLDAFENLAGEAGVLDDGIPFFAAEVGVLVKDGVGDGEFAEIVQQGRAADQLDSGPGRGASPWRARWRLRRLRPSGGR